MQQISITITVYEKVCEDLVTVFQTITITNSYIVLCVIFKLYKKELPDGRKKKVIGPLSLQYKPHNIIMGRMWLKNEFCHCVIRLNAISISRKKCISNISILIHNIKTTCYYLSINRKGSVESNI